MQNNRSMFGRVQEAIVFSPSLRIAERGKGCGHSFKDLRILGIVLCAIGMIALGKLPVGSLDLLKGGITL
jgi:hypothetical protein